MRLQTEEALKAIKFFASSSTFEQKLADFAHLGQQLANSPAFVESLTDIELPNYRPSPLTEQKLADFAQQLANSPAFADLARAVETIEETLPDEPSFYDTIAERMEPGLFSCYGGLWRIGRRAGAGTAVASSSTGATGPRRWSLRWRCTVVRSSPR